MNRLMPYHTTQLPACRRLDRVLRQMDPFLFTVYNGGLGTYEVWRRNPSGSLAKLFDNEIRPGVRVSIDHFGRKALQLLREMDTEPEELIRGIEEHNRRLVEQRRRRDREELEEITRYLAPVIRQELDGGTPRHSWKDAEASARRAFGLPAEG